MNAFTQILPPSSGATAADAAAQRTALGIMLKAGMALLPGVPVCRDLSWNYAGYGGGTTGTASAWVTATSYTAGDLVKYEGQVYTANSTHTSGTWATDVAANKWTPRRSYEANFASRKGNFWQYFRVGFRCSDLRFAYVNRHTSDVANTNSITVSAGLQANSGGTVYPLFFNGKRSVDIEAGAYAITDPISLDFLAASEWLIRTHVALSADGHFWPRSRFVGYGGNEKTEATDETGLDKSISGTIYSSATQPMFGPCFATATAPNAPATIAVVGDSISHGQGDGTDLPIGFARRALDGVRPYFMASCSGETAGLWAGGGHVSRGVFIAASKYAMVHYGSNDFAGGASLATWQATMGPLWLSLQAQGMSVIACTVPPRSTSTDSWATEGNQTTHANNSLRVSYNSWLLGLDAAGLAAQGLTAILDTAAAVESTTSGKWKNSHTSDGTHPNATGAAAMAAVVTAYISGGGMS